MLDRLGVAIGLSKAKVPLHTFYRHILPRQTLVLNKLGLKGDGEQRGDNSIILFLSGKSKGGLWKGRDYSEYRTCMGLLQTKQLRGYNTSKSGRGRKTEEAAAVISFGP